MYYDIRTQSNALKTLSDITGISQAVWQTNFSKRAAFKNDDDFLSWMISTYSSSRLCRYEDLIFIFSHITTANDGCEYIKNHGIKDLRTVYEDKGSELRKFLDDHSICIDIQNKKLKYAGDTYDIRYSYENSILGTENTQKSHESAIGYKFYKDYAVNGFMYLDRHHIYGGNIHKRPEILQNIDDLLGTNLSQEWERSNSAYEITAKVLGKDILYSGQDYGYADEHEMMMYYVGQAYSVATADQGYMDIYVTLINGLSVPAFGIEIKPFSYIIAG